MRNENAMDKVVSLCKRRGFIFPSSEIYGGLGSSWDYGPLGAELKKNVKDAWWREMVHWREDMVGLDAAILMHPKTWEASGHVATFHDLLVDCKDCKGRFRQDHIDGTCPSCGSKNFTEPRAFNLMLKTHLGAVESQDHVCYLRPETAQGIFVNFKNVLDSTHRKLPFGIAQIGKSFRNEVTAGNFTFRMREFEQMEIEYFTRPQEAEDCYQQWIETRRRWYLDLGLNPDRTRLREHTKDELAHYAAGCTDIEYEFPFGWSELEGIANRTDYDLKQHADCSGQDLRYFDPVAQERFFPYVIEPSGGVDRATLAFLVDAYHEEEVKGRTRVVLRLHPRLAPIKVAVLPLLKKNQDIVTMARRLKHYRRQDESGTCFCVTVDVQSLEDRQVTVRDRDTMRQDRVAIERVKEYFQDKNLFS